MDEIPCEEYIEGSIKAAIFLREEKGRFREAEEKILEVAKCAKESKNVHRAKMMVYSQLAITYEKMGRYDELKELCERMILEVDYRHSAPFHRLLSEYYLHFKDIRESLEQAHWAYHLAKKYAHPDLVWYSHQVVTVLAMQPGISESAMQQTVEKERRDLVYSLSQNPSELERDTWTLSAYLSALRFHRTLLRKYKFEWVREQLMKKRFWLRVYRILTKGRS